MPLAKKFHNYKNYDTLSGRYYHSEVNPDLWFPSVTTILSYEKNKNAKTPRGGYSGPAASLGSLTHFHCLRKFANTPLKMPSDPLWGITKEEASRRLSECLRMWHELIAPLDINPIAVETVVWNKHPRYAGRIDMLAKINNVLTLIDIKTGAHYPESHGMQAAAYWQALKRAPKQVQFYYMDAIVDRNPSKEGSILTYTKLDLEYWYEEFLNVYANFGGSLDPEIIQDLI